MRYRGVRWIGDPSPWSDPTIAKALATSTLSFSLIERLRFYDKWQRQLVVPGRTSRTLGLESGFSRSYTFGPHQFFEWMTPEDADHLFHNRWDRWQFLDVTHAPSQVERPRMSKEQWQQLLADFALLGPGRIAGARLSANQAAKDAAQRQRQGDPMFVQQTLAARERAAA